MVRFLSRVDSQVALQSLKVPETGATDFTRIGLLASVDEHMGTEVGHLDGKAKRERLCRGERHTPRQPHTQVEGSFPTPPAHLYKSGSAGFAFVGLLSRVNSSVGFQVCRSVELGPTDVTAIGFLTCYQEKGEKDSYIQRTSP